MELGQWHLILRSVHIGLGSIALILFWMPIFSRKGGRIHVISGKVFNLVAYGVAATASVSCGWAIVAPINFSGVTRELSADEVERLAGNIRFLFTVLFTLMTWLVAAIKMGQHTISEKSDLRVRSATPRLFWRTAMMASLALGGYGICLVVSGDFRGLVPLFLCWVGVSDSCGSLRVLGSAPEASTIWIEKHIESVIGVGIGLYTAFFVFGLERVSGIELSGIGRLVPWLAPAAIGIPATSLLCKRYRRIFRTGS